MSLTVQDNGKKWIQASIAVTCLFLVYVLIRFFGQLAEWFELEAKIPYFLMISQGISLLIALGVFGYIMTNPKTSSFLEEVYQETTKVVWPDKSDTVKHTIIIMIGVTIVGIFLGLFDLTATWLLSLIS